MSAALCRNDAFPLLLCPKKERGLRATFQEREENKTESGWGGEEEEEEEKQTCLVQRTFKKWSKKCSPF